MSSFGEKLDLFDCIYVHQPEIWPTVEAHQEVVSNGMLFCILFNIWDFCARGFATTATIILLKVQVVHHNYAWKVNYDGYVVHRNQDSCKKCREIEKKSQSGHRVNDECKSNTLSFNEISMRIKYSMTQGCFKRKKTANVHYY